MSKRPFDYTKYDRRRYTLHKLLHSRKHQISLRLHKITQVLGLIFGRFTAYFGAFSTRFRKIEFCLDLFIMKKSVTGNSIFTKLSRLGVKVFIFRGPK